MPRRIAVADPFFLALIIALGFAVVWAVLMNWGFDMAQQFFGPERSFEYLELRMDGTPVVAISTRSDYNNRTYHSLEEAPLSISSREAWLRGTYLSTPKDHRANAPDWFDRSGWEGRIAAFNSGDQPTTYWYFIVPPPQRDSGYFVGFDSVGKQRVGYMGRGGFQTRPPTAGECFPVHHHPTARSAAVSTYYFGDDEEPFYSPFSQGSGRLPGWMVYVLTDDGVTEVDLLKRSTRVVLKQTGLLSAGHLERGLTSPVAMDSDAYRSKVREFLVVRGEDRILILDSSGKQESSFAIPAELQHRNFEFYLLHDSSAVIEPPRDDPSQRYQLLRIDTTGKIVHRTDYVLDEHFAEAQTSLWPVALSAPVALVAAVSTVLAPWYLLWLPLAATCLLGGVLPWLVRRRQQRYGLPWTKTWMVLVFLAGLPGLVGYYAHRRWPPIAKCPACGRAVPHDRDACIGCGNEFPQPAPKGTEVFA